ncbi:ornithine cyclodeaminase family protein [Streptomyces sp. NPDC086033]|uniref:ornithine cyclodeaminase family protein n=1 Tax=Streptomyces sp. NPDC086033 TaxID=3365747 RepID=UPI0037D7C10A
MAVYLTDDDVRSLLDWESALKALHEAYAAPVSEAHFPPRTMARGEQEWMRTLSGILPSSGVMGAKLIAVSNGKRRGAYLVALFDLETTELVALLDGRSITGFRTAATSALAVRFLAPQRPLSVAVIGSGFEATNHLRALAATRELTSVRVYSPSPASRARFAGSFSDLAADVVPADAPEDAVDGVDLVLCAARSRDETPTVRGTWLKPGTTVVSIGSTLPEQRELDPVAIDRADVVVCDLVDEVAHETGDFIAARAEGVEFTDKLASLADVVSGRAPGRTGTDDIVLYKSVGSALQDLTVAALCARLAGERGAGGSLDARISRGFQEH